MVEHGKVLYEKNTYDTAYPASLTKMLTAIVVMENCNLTDIVIYDEDKALEGIQSGYITSNLDDGEQVTIEEMLNLLLISSYNDIANMLAIHVSGSIDAFSELMNKKATEIGCKNTHFINTNGTHNEHHYTTAYDMALIARYAMKYEALRGIVNKIYFTLEDSTGRERIYETTNGLLLKGDPTAYYKYARGIKTGFTTPAGSCLATYAVKDDMELYVVVLKCESSTERYANIKTLFNYGFDNYSNKIIAKKGEDIQTLDVKNGTAKSRKLNGVLETDIIAIIKDDAKYTIEPKVTMNSELVAPIEKGTVIGEVIYEIDGVTYKTRLLAGNDVEKTYMPQFFILLFITLIFVLGTVKFVDYMKRKKRIKKIRRI